MQSEIMDHKQTILYAPVNLSNSQKAVSTSKSQSDASHNAAINAT